MKNVLFMAGLAFGLAACASTPQPRSVAQSLNPSDPLFDTPECRAARDRVAIYEKRLGHYLANAASEGFKAGFLLRRVRGKPVVTNEEIERNAIVADMKYACVTGYKSGQ